MEYICKTLCRFEASMSQREHLLNLLMLLPAADAIVAVHVGCMIVLSST
jgi:hypothetical protein